MPNMLAHVGVQGVLTRTLLRDADFKVIFLGCLLPDVPWILLRIIRLVAPDFDLYTAQLYAIVQASLFMTLLLCGGLAALSKCPGSVFGILALNSVLHLILDSLQTKWANGVHLFAPASWKLLNFGLFWPESLPTYMLTILGLGYMSWAWRHAVKEPFGFFDCSPKRYVLSGGLFVLYFTLPIFFLHGPFIEDNHYIQTLQSKNERVGRFVEFDRKPYLKRAQDDVLELIDGEELQIQESRLDHSSSVSIRARFIEPHTIKILAIHEHSRSFRDGSTYIGLVLLLTMWAVAYGRTRGFMISHKRKK